MLVLSRKPGESILIGDVTVHIAEFVGNSVRVAIDAPKEVLILRSELEERNDNARG